MKRYIFLFLLLVLTSCEKNEITSSLNGNVDRRYPTTLYKLSQPELDSLQVKFNNKLLGTGNMAVMDSFGFLGYHEILSRGKSDITDTAQAVALAKAALLHLREFSNIVDTSTLYVQDATHYNTMGITDWRISFKNQYYNGMEVWYTRILAIVADDFILIDGRHYNNIFIPKYKIISKERTKKQLMGTVIHYECWTPGTFVISDSTISLEAIEECIYPVRKSNSIELHVAWKVPIVGFMSQPMWYYFVDVVTGETIGVMQLFIC